MQNSCRVSSSTLLMTVRGWEYWRYPLVVTDGEDRSKSPNKLCEWMEYLTFVSVCGLPPRTDPSHVASNMINASHNSTLLNSLRRGNQGMPLGEVAKSIVHFLREPSFQHCSPDSLSS